MNAGGAETFLMKVYRGLDKAKYQMDFAVAVPEKGFYDDEIISLGGKIFHIIPKSEGVLKNFNAIKNLVKKEQYKYVLRTSQHSLSALELLAAKLGGAKVRVFRSSNSNTTTGTGMDLFLHKLCRFMPMLFANVRIAPSTEAAEFMFGKGCIGNGKAKLINNGIDLHLYRYNEEERMERRKEFGINDEILIGHIGRFNKQKNHAKLLKVFSTFHSENANSKLMLVGVGELEDVVRNIVKEYKLEESVIFTGVRKDIPSLLCAMDVYVFPSLYEGMPNTVIEAQATGLPCVISSNITKEADLSDIIYINVDKNEQEWCEAIKRSIDKKIDREACTELLEKARYSINTVTADFVKNIFGE